MEKVNGSFTIQINDQPVCLVEDSSEPRIHASLGTSPAVFSLIDGRLESGDWILGRFLVEDRSLNPKKVFWFKKQDTDLKLVQKTLAVPNGDSLVLVFAGKR